MEWIAEAFRAGGVWMYVVLALSILAWPSSVLAVIVSFKMRRRVGLIAGAACIAVGLLTIGVGSVGTFFGAQTAMQAAEKVAPEDYDAVIEKGIEEASYPGIFGAYGGMVPIILGGIAFGVAALLKEGES